MRALRALGAWGPRGTLNLFSSTRFQPYESTYHLLEALFYTSIYYCEALLKASLLGCETSFEKSEALLEREVTSLRSERLSYIVKLLKGFL